MKVFLELWTTDESCELVEQTKLADIGHLNGSRYFELDAPDNIVLATKLQQGLGTDLKLFLRIDD